jgi:hypothetical protein
MDLDHPRVGLPDPGVYLHDLRLETERLDREAGPRHLLVDLQSGEKVACLQCGAYRGEEDRGPAWS